MLGKKQQGNESYEILKHYKAIIIIKQQGIAIRQNRQFRN